MSKYKNISTYSKIIFTLIATITVMYFGGKYIYYGSFVRNCIYTSNEIHIPVQIGKGQIVVAKNAYLAVGIDNEYSCVKDFENINREIVGPESINNPTIARGYYTNKGLSVQPLKKGARFRVVNIIAVTKHGISTIDSGPGPIYYLILKDNNGTLYRIATVSLGLNKEDLFLAFVSTSKSINSPLKLLSWESFSEKVNGKAENSLEYTGILTELPKKLNPM